MSKPIKIGAIRFKSIAEACRKKDVSYMKVIQRIAKGMSYNDAFRKADFREVSGRRLKQKLFGDQPRKRKSA